MNTQRNGSSWNPHDWASYGTGGIIDSNGNVHELSIVEGIRKNDGQTLISDGIQSRRDFNRHHDHYGDSRGGGRIEDKGGDRGNYTGPGSR
jgi:hypothetical protein